MKSQMLMTISAAALSAAFGLTCAFAGPTDNEGGPSGAAGSAAPKMAPSQPGPSSDAGPQSGMSGKDKSAAEAKSGDREQVGEATRSSDPLLPSSLFVVPRGTRNLYRAH